jgi:hypothetical protein
MTYRKGAPSSGRVHCVGGDSRQAPVNLGCFEAVGFKPVFGYGDEDYVLVRDARANTTTTSSNSNENNTLGKRVWRIAQWNQSRWSIGKGFNKGVWKVRWFPKIIDS